MSLNPAAILTDLHTASNALDRAEAAGDFDRICALRADLYELSAALEKEMDDELQPGRGTRETGAAIRGDV